MDSALDSHQKRSGTEAGNNTFDVEGLQNHDEFPTSSEVNFLAKRRKLETNPMKMGNIVENIISFLNVKSVKELRRISKLWSSEGAKRLFKMCFVSIPFAQEDLLQEAEFGNISTEQLEFEAFLAHRSSDIPVIPNITIQRESDFNVWKSLGVLGPQVNNLKVTYFDDKFEQFYNLLNLLTNLKYLDLEGPFSSGYWDDDYVNKIISSVMSTAPEDRTPLMLSGISIDPENEEELEEVEKFSECSKIKTEKLYIQVDPGHFIGVPTFRARIVTIVEKLLSTNHDTFTELTLSSCDPYLSLIKFPRMTLLTHLYLTFYGSTDNIRFSKSFDFSKNCPNLLELKVYYGGEEKEIESFMNLFENTGTAPSVKRLRMDYFDKATNIVIDRIFHVFPSIEVFKAPCTDLCQVSLKSLWKQGEKLKKLRISINLDDFDKDPLKLDSIITRFEEGTVKELKSCQIPSCLKELRVGPSILNLKNLEYLDIFLEGNFSGIDDVLQVTGDHAFKLMSSNMAIGINFRCKHTTNILNKVSTLPNVSIIQTKNYVDFLLCKLRTKFHPYVAK